jgi:hypothetical protein
MAGGKTGGRKKQGTGSGSAGWQKPHSDLSRVDPGLLRQLDRWNKTKTFKHQFRMAATKIAPVTSPTTHHNISTARPTTKQAQPLGLAAVKYAQAMRQSRHAAVLESFNHQQQKHGAGARRPDKGPMNMGELYAYYKRNGMLEAFFSLFPG